MIKYKKRGNEGDQVEAATVRVMIGSNPVLPLEAELTTEAEDAVYVRVDAE